MVLALGSSWPRRKGKEISESVQGEARGTELGPESVFPSAVENKNFPPPRGRRDLQLYFIWTLYLQFKKVTAKSFQKELSKKMQISIETPESSVAIQVAHIPPRSTCLCSRGPAQMGSGSHQSTPTAGFHLVSTAGSRE